MDIATRIISFFFLFVCHLSVAHAAYQYFTVSGSGTGAKYDSAVSACQVINPGQTISSAQQYAGGQRHICYVGNFQSGDVYGFNCPSGQVFSSGSCAPVNNCPPAGTIEGDSSNAVVSNGISATSVCLGEGSSGCQWTGGGSVPSVCANGKCYTYGPFRATGNACDPSATGGGSQAPAPSASAPVADVQCVTKGQCPGTVNGVAVCVACSSKSQTTVESTAKAASSAASGAPVSTSTQQGTTTKKTECVGGSCTTTTTTTNNKSDGSSETQSETKTEPQTSFCDDNPKAAVCKEDTDSSWGGSCQAFTCDGDAVQCAQAQASWKTACAMEGEPDARHQAGEAAMAGGDRPSGHPGSDPESIPVALASAIDSSPLFSSSGACPDDVTLTVQGQTVTLPFSDMCPYLNMLGAAFMAACYLMGAFIVFRS